MMKKIAFCVLLVFIVMPFTAVAAEEGNFIIRPFAGVTLGSENWLRGAGAGVQAKFKLAFLYPGAQAAIEYDAGFAVVELPIFVVLGLGRDFWFMGGWTIPFGTPTLLGAAGVIYELGPTFGLGFNWFPLDLGPGTLKPYTEISYVVANPSAGDPLIEGLGFLAGILLGLKAQIGVSYELSF